MSDPQQLVPGIRIDRQGRATVEGRLTSTLCDLAIDLEEALNLPVDVEHVLGAVLLAARQGELPSERELSAEDPALRAVLAEHVKAIYREHGGDVGDED